MSISRISRIAMFAALATIYRQSVDENTAATSNANADGTASPEQIAQAEADAKAAAEKAAAEKSERLKAVQAKFDNTVDVKEISFYFRTIEDKATGVKTKRPTVELPVPVPSFEGVIASLEKGGKEADLILEAVAGIVVDQVREYVNENESVNADNFPYERFLWSAIANMPKAERRGGGIAKELWDDFAKDYVELMPALTQKTKEQVELAAKVFVSKFANAKTNKPVLRVLQSQLAIYTANTKQGDQLEPVISWLTNKLDTLINTDESKLLEAL